MFCINTGCISSDTGDDGLCDKCRELLEKERKREIEREAYRTALLADCEESGKYLSDQTRILNANTKRGLSQFEDDVARAERRAKRKANRETREAEREKRRKERIENSPKGMGGQKDEGGNGTSRKARQKAKKRHSGSQFFRNANHGLAVRHKK